MVIGVEDDVEAMLLVYPGYLLFARCHYMRPLGGAQRHHRRCCMFLLSVGFSRTDAAFYAMPQGSNGFAYAAFGVIAQVVQYAFS